MIWVDIVPPIVKNIVIAKTGLSVKYVMLALVSIVAVIMVVKIVAPYFV